jgi:AraC family transcriptional regulator
LAKIAVALEQALTRRSADGTPGHLETRIVAGGEGWTVEDIVCTSGPHDRSFEERHSDFRIAVVVAGSFQYRSELAPRARRGELMTPGSLLLGNAGHCFECGHEHGTGDRCIAFGYAPDHFEHLAADAGIRAPRPELRATRLPPLRVLSPLVAQACAGLVGSLDAAWEEISLHLAARALRLANGYSNHQGDPPSAAVARVTRIVRAIERHPDAQLSLARLAREAGLSPYHFLRVFQHLTGVTPHQYVLRARMREAASQLAAEPSRVLDIALACGFGDVSNFNRAFKAEFGVSPRIYRGGASNRLVASRNISSHTGWRRGATTCQQV